MSQWPPSPKPCPVSPQERDGLDRLRPEGPDNQQAGDAASSLQHFLSPCRSRDSHERPGLRDAVCPLTLPGSKQSLSPGPSISNCRKDLTLPPSPGLSCKRRQDRLHRRPGEKPRQRSHATLCGMGHFGRSPPDFWLPPGTWGPQPWAHGSGSGSKPQKSGCTARPGRSRRTQSRVSRVVLPTHQRPAHSPWNAPPAARPRPRHRRPGPPAWESPDCGDLQDLRFLELFVTSLRPGGKSAGPGFTGPQRGCAGRELAALAAASGVWALGARVRSGWSLRGPLQCAPFLPSPPVFPECFWRSGAEKGKGPCSALTRCPFLSSMNAGVSAWDLQGYTLVN